MIYAENVLICIAVPLVIASFFVGGGAKRFVTAFVSGMTVCLLSAYIGGYFAQVSGMGAQDTAIFLSPVLEEIMKLMPVLFYLFVSEPRDRNLMMVAVGIGAGFATFENCCQLLSGGAGSLTYVMIRGFAAGVMHVASLFALSMALVFLRRYQAFTLAVVIGALSLSASVHALYNLLVSVPGVPSFLGYALPLCCCLALYLPYRRVLAGEE